MKNIYKYTSKRLDVHLMVKNPKKYIIDYATLNTEYITFHIETEDVLENLELIKRYGIKCGLAIKPNTEVKELVPYLPLLDMILVMSVEPGEGGQAFIDETKSKINELNNTNTNITQDELNTYLNDIEELRKQYEDITSKKTNLQLKINNLKNDISNLKSKNYTSIQYGALQGSCRSFLLFFMSSCNVWSINACFVY